MLYGPYSLAEIKPRLDIHGLAIGVFDGVHLGHRAVISSLMEEHTAVLTFEPHPLYLIAPERAPHRLTTMEQKGALMRTMGVKLVFAARFNEALRDLTASAFVQQINRIFPVLRYIAIGEDWSFGKNREGNPARLTELAAQYNIQVKVIPPVPWQGLPISSTRIRDAIWARNMEDANAMLGWNYAITGKVKAGDQRGRRIGFPTANLEDVWQLHPAPGVYAVQVHVATRNRNYLGVMNIGNRPTVAAHLDMSLEVHLLDFEGDLYDQNLVVYDFRWIREEKRFASMDELKAQILNDVIEARASFSNGG